jgi:predicted ATPase/class 3 adenylate cyclase/Tfp pilus assembly protein PilF
MSESAPTGNITIVFTDIEGSTELWERMGDDFKTILDLHNDIVRKGIAQYDGYEVKTEGDAFMIAFASSQNAVLCCLEIQRMLHQAVWPRVKNSVGVGAWYDTEENSVFRGLRVRMGAHTGDPMSEIDTVTKRRDYFGPDINRAARISSAAHGGQLLVSNTTWETLTEMVDVSITDLGEHALRGLNVEEHIRQILPSSLAGRAFPLLKTVLLRKTNLTDQQDSFVGRGTDLKNLHQLILDGKSLITVMAMGGMGKTRLTQEYARQHLADFTGGIWFCDLTESHHLDGFLSAVGQGLGIPLLSNEPEEQLGRAIQQRGSVLVVLDNVEQIVGIVVPTLECWIRQAPMATFLVTSRVQLNIKEEHVLHLHPHRTHEAIQLFVERAGTARPGFVLNQENRYHIRDIVEALDGLALAVELAAARIRVLSPAQILQRLNQRFRLLRTQSRDRSPRQQTLYGAIDWSWELLAPMERECLAQCSAFRGGFTLEAAESVVHISSDNEWCLDAINTLVESSLLRTWEQSPGQMRLGLLESIRLFAAEKLTEYPTGSPIAESAVVTRHFNFYTELGTDESLDALFSHRGVQRYRSRIIEIDNLMTAVHAAIRVKNIPCAVHCALAAHSVFTLVGPSADALTLLNDVLSLDGLTPQHQARLLMKKGQTLSRLGHLHESLTCLDKAHEISIDRDDQWMLARVKGSIGNVHYRLKSVAEAQTFCEDALSLHQTVGDRRFEGQVYANLANIYRHQGRIKEAIGFFEKALQIHREVGNRVFEGAALGNLGCLRDAQGETAAARDCFESALSIHREVGNKLFEGLELANLGSLLCKSGNLVVAEKVFTSAIEILDELVPIRAAENRCRLASIYATTQRIEEAQALLYTAEQVVRPQHSESFCMLLCIKAQIAYDIGNVAEAEVFLKEAEDIGSKSNAGPGSRMHTKLVALKRHMNHNINS